MNLLRLVLLCLLLGWLLPLYFVLAVADGVFND